MADNLQPSTPSAELTTPLATRRDVVKAAWTVPVIVALGMNPIQAFARGNSNSSSASNGGSVAQISNCNNGFGNGDQCAPGNSGPNNGAENDQGNKGNNGGGKDKDKSKDKGRSHANSFGYNYDL